MVKSDSLANLSAALGWIYFLAWSVSFYPQVILNYRRKRSASLLPAHRAAHDRSAVSVCSVVGFSFDFLAWNISGYVFYSTYTIATFIEQNRLGLTQVCCAVARLQPIHCPSCLCLQSVEPNDVAFATHGFVLTLVQISQCFIYEVRI